jgi:hypothetical protein
VSAPTAPRFAACDVCDVAVEIAPSGVVPRRVRCEAHPSLEWARCRACGQGYRWRGGRGCTACGATNRPPRTAPCEVCAAAVTLPTYGPPPASVRCADHLRTVPCEVCQVPVSCSPIGRPPSHPRCGVHQVVQRGTRSVPCAVCRTPVPAGRRGPLPATAWCPDHDRRAWATCRCGRPYRTVVAGRPQSACHRCNFRRRRARHLAEIRRTSDPLSY